LAPASGALEPAGWSLQRASERRGLGLTLDPGETGALLAFAGFAWWGLAPIYFKVLAHVPAAEMLAHRVLWSVLLLGALALVRGGLGPLLAELGARGRIRVYLATTLLLSGNWLLFIWSIQQGRLVEVSLGYYINPLVNVLLGILFLGERLNRPQALAVLLATLGVVVQLVAHGQLPWISLVLALTFGLYGLLRKRAQTDATRGLLLETLMMAPLALGYLWYLGLTQRGAFLQHGLATDLLLVAAGVVTTVPLLLFLEGAKRIRLATLGLMQYVAPSLQLGLAVLAFGEDFKPSYALTFALIWAALAVYSLDAFRSRAALMRR
jgi:chloramphenicol-sensitive protein RarD